MNLRELIAAKNTLVNEAKNLIAEGKTADAKAKESEIVDLNNRIETLVNIEDEEKKNLLKEINAIPAVENKVKTEGVNMVYNSALFAKMLKNFMGTATLNEDEKDFAVKNETLIKESDEKGTGIVVPKDISDKIISYREQLMSVEKLVNVEKVRTLEGSRNVELNAEIAPFPPVDEAEKYPDAPKPDVKPLTYKVKKYGDILKVTQELIDDAPNFFNFLVKWFGERGTATRNFLVTEALKAEYTTKTEVKTFDDIKKIVNTKLPIGSVIGVITNQDGFNALDTMKTEDGKYALMPDLTRKTDDVLLFGKYRIVVLPNEILKTEAGKAPVFIGNMKAITIFDRERNTIDFNSQGAGYWEYDKVGMKGRERLDVKIANPLAIVAGEITVGV